MKVLGTVPVCDAVYTVKVGNASDFQPLETCYGVCDQTNRVIWLHDNLPPEKTLSTLAHETLHALIQESGLLQVTEAVLGEANLDKWEEAIVRLLTPHIMGTFGPPQLEKRRGRKL